DLDRRVVPFAPESAHAPGRLRRVVAAVVRRSRDPAELFVDVDLGSGPRLEADRARFKAVEAELQAVLTAPQIEVVRKSVEVVGGPDVRPVEVDARGFGRNVGVDDRPVRGGPVSVIASIAVVPTVVGAVSVPVRAGPVIGPSPTPSPAPVTAVVTAVTA